MELSITELRAQRRPLWMSYLGAENYADLFGGGGDIWFDRLPLQWERDSDAELMADEREEAPETSKQTAKDKPN